MGELEQTDALRAAVIEVAERILSTLQEARTSGAELRADYVDKVVADLRESLSVTSVLAHELRAFGRELEALERLVLEGDLTDRGAILGRIDRIHEQLFSRKLGLHFMYQRLRDRGIER